MPMAYQPYRGKRGSKRGRLILALSLILVVLVAAAVLFFVLQEHIVFTAEGFRFDFPAKAQQTTVPPDDTATSLPPVVIETQPTTAPPPTTAPAPVIEKRSGLTNALLFDYDTYADAALPDGADRKAVYLQDRDGIPRIPSEFDFDTATPEQEALFEALEGTSDVAVLSYFRNHAGAARARAFAAVVAGGQTWIDHNGNRWMNPYRTGLPESESGLTHEEWLVSPDARRMGQDYAGLTLARGLGELVLTNFHFPTVGQLGIIVYPEYDSVEARVDTLAGEAQWLRGYLDTLQGSIGGDAPQPLLSCLLTEAAASLFIDEVSGQSVAELAHAFDILYVPTADPDYDVGPLYEVIDGTDCRIGLWLSSGTAPAREIDFILVP